ncbi:GGDEF domain-containing protein [Gynuella sp.]|jgi:diguanylate cyclase|uniref:GGDEF domain-containing protein n=1 Tax=Gynuella sp. TaxID=2969146 RepID=UPI003D0DA01D
MQTFIDWLLTTNPQRRIRLQLTGVATLLMLACVAVLNLLARFSGTQPLAIYVWTFFALGGLVVFFLLIRSGYSERWQDPSLALIQISYAIAANAVAYALAGEGRGVVPSILAVILMFSMFGLLVRQIIIVSLFALLSFGSAVAYVVWHSQGSNAWSLEVANTVMILIVLSGGTFLTSRLQHLREGLNTQKKELEAALEHIHQIALFDELTGLMNRRSMNELLAQECLRSDRNGRTFTVALLDIDHFKKINDSYGHRAGDIALKRFAETAEQTIRATDHIARWGGEEFLLVLPETEPPSCVMNCLNRVRERITAIEINHEGQQFSFTVSIGFSTRRDNEMIEHTIDRADQALYSAKQNGRDRVVAG